MPKSADRASRSESSTPGGRTVVVNGRRISDHALAEGDVIRLGDVSLAFQSLDD